MFDNLERRECDDKMLLWFCTTAFRRLQYKTHDALFFHKILFAEHERYNK